MIAFLDEVRSASPGLLDRQHPPLTKAERGLRDLRDALHESLQWVSYGDPDIICALPEEAVRRAYPEMDFPGWDTLLGEWGDHCATVTEVPFKEWVLARRRGLPRSQRPRGFRCCFAA